MTWSTKYELIRKLDEGGQGTTHLVRPKGDTRAEYVLKLLKDGCSAERRRRMHREVAALRTLEHARIARHIESNTENYGDRNVELYVISEFIPGTTLSHFKNIELKKSVGCVLAVLEAVGHCHDRTVIHRDIKPANIMARHGDVTDPVLIDFGLSFNLAEPGPEATFAGQHLGNRFIMVPEYRTDGADSRSPVSDITHVVGLLFYLLTGVPPGMLIDDKGAPPHRRPTARQALSALLPWQTQLLDRVFDRGFASVVNSRWQSTSELKLAVVPLLEDSAPQDPLPFAKRLSEAIGDFDNSPTLVRRRLWANLVNHFGVVARDLPIEIVRSTKGEFHIHFSRWEVDDKAGSYSASGNSSHKHFSNSQQLICLSMRITNDEVKTNLEVNHMIRFRGAFNAFDPEVKNTLRQWIENTFVSYLRDRTQELLNS